MAKVMITIPDEFLKEIDAVAKAEHRTRSELFREAVRKYMQNTSKQIQSNAIDAFHRLQNTNIPWEEGQTENTVQDLRDKAGK